MIANPRRAQGPSIDRPKGLSEPLEQLRYEFQIFEALTAGCQTLRLWQSQRAIIVTATEARLAGFAAAAERARSRGWAVAVRRSGGGAVCVGPGVLVVSFLHQTVRNDLNESYRMFADAVTRAISDLGVGGLGIALDVGHVVGAYCDGRFDLAWQGLKVGGIAQRRRVVEGGVNVWIHAVLSIETLAEPYTAEVARLYADLGSLRVADPARTTSLARCFGSGRAPADLLGRCAQGIAGAFRTLQVQA